MNYDIVPVSVPEDAYRLVQTCGAYPEQYDMLNSKGEAVGYFRLRHGKFRVYYPDYGGEVVYYAEPEGDGVFMDYERDYYLNQGMLAVIQEEGWKYV